MSRDGIARPVEVGELLERILAATESAELLVSDGKVEAADRAIADRALPLRGLERLVTRGQAALSVEHRELAERIRASEHRILSRLAVQRRASVEERAALRRARAALAGVRRGRLVDHRS